MIDGHTYDSNWVEVIEYTPLWIDIFNNEKSLLRRALGDIALDIQHVGSTSISGLAAKPIIDIIIGVKNIELFSTQVMLNLENVDYVFRGDAGVPGRIFFRKGFPRAKYHLSIATLNGDYWRNQIVFRDYLRSHPDDAIEYQNLKVKLAYEYSNDRVKYTKLKEPFIRKILDKAYSKE